MNSFLKKCLLFSLILFGYFGINYSTNYIIIKSKKFSITEKLWIIGDSHPMTSLNPELMHNARMLAQTAEPYPVTFLKLKQFLRFGKPDTILLGFGYHNISNFNDIKLTDKQWSDEMFKRIYSFIQFHELKQYEINYYNFGKFYLKHILIYPSLNPTKYFGTFKKSYHKLDTMKSSLSKVIERHYFINNKPCDISAFALPYLDSIITFCVKHDIKVILINSPVTREYFSKIPENIKLRYITKKMQITENGTTVVDFSNMNYPIEDFMNYDHLNLDGANVFTKDFLNYLKGKSH